MGVGSGIFREPAQVNAAIDMNNDLLHVLHK